jgi:uncharacterized damage-inducible protein DinB
MTPALLLKAQLDAVTDVVMSMDTASYVARPLREVSGSIGEHVRHCLDHIAALAASTSMQPLSYDRRERGTAIETDPAEAMRLILRLNAALDRWSGPSLDDPISVTSLVAPGQSVTGWSTVGRELAFVASHTVHHQALIALLLAVQGLAVPDRLGYAPSTPRRAV